MSRFVETPEDVAVKRRLWDSTEAEVLFFAKKHAEMHVRGQSEESETQKDVLCAAKSKLYKKSLVRKCAKFIRADDPDGLSGALRGFRTEIGLNV